MPTTSEVLTHLMPVTETLTGVKTTVRGNSPSDVLTFSEQLFYTFTPDPNRIAVTSGVAVAQTVVHDRVADHGNAASVGQTVGLNFVRLRKPTDTLTITQSVIAYKPKSTFVDPAAAAYVAGLTPSITVGGVLGVAHPHQFRLSYAATDCYLRNPDFSDKSSYQQVRVQRKSRGGDLQIGRVAMWPTTEILSFKFSYLDPADRDNLSDFLVLSLGQKIDLYDQYGRHWQGTIMQPGGKIAGDKRATSSAEFTFQGALV